MPAPKYVKPGRIWLKTHPDLTEKWLQDRIGEDPSLLGLGDLVLRDRERPQAGAGRLDLLLQDAEANRRYKVEIQLGRTDESHIIRTIEYWVIERKRYPQYEHIAVIVAADILAEALFERIDVLGAREATIRPTDTAVAYGFAAAIPDRFDVTVGYGRGERSGDDNIDKRDCHPRSSDGRERGGPLSGAGVHLREAGACNALGRAQPRGRSARPGVWASHRDDPPSPPVRAGNCPRILTRAIAHGQCGRGRAPGRGAVTCTWPPSATFRDQRSMSSSQASGSQPTQGTRSTRNGSRPAARSAGGMEAPQQARTARVPTARANRGSAGPPSWADR